MTRATPYTSARIAQSIKPESPARGALALCHTRWRTTLRPAILPALCTFSCARPRGKATGLASCNPELWCEAVTARLRPGSRAAYFIAGVTAVAVRHSVLRTSLAATAAPFRLRRAEPALQRTPRTFYESDCQGRFSSSLIAFSSSPLQSAPSDSKPRSASAWGWAVQSRAADSSSVLSIRS